MSGRTSPEPTPKAPPSKEERDAQERRLKIIAARPKKSIGMTVETPSRSSWPWVVGVAIVILIVGWFWGRDIIEALARVLG